MIRANCRDRFTYDDFAFIQRALAKEPKGASGLATLLTDPESRDLVLDDDALSDAIVSEKSLTRISPYLYFYVLTRRVLLQQDIDNRNVADYVASMLADFSSTRRSRTIGGASQKEYYYFVDMMADYMSAKSTEAFLIRSHMGNYALFMSGVFPEFVFRRATYGRRAPGFDYYETMGSRSYRWASEHNLAIKYRLGDVLALLAERFRAIRIALNKLADNYLILDEGPESLDKMLRQLFFGGNEAPPSP